MWTGKLDGGGGNFLDEEATNGGAASLALSDSFITNPQSGTTMAFSVTSMSSVASVAQSRAGVRRSQVTTLESLGADYRL